MMKILQKYIKKFLVMIIANGVYYIRLDPMFFANLISAFKAKEKEFYEKRS